MRRRCNSRGRRVGHDGAAEQRQHTVRPEGPPAFPGPAGVTQPVAAGVGAVFRLESCVSSLSGQAQAAVNVGVQIPGHDPPLNSFESIPEVGLLDPVGVLCLMF